MKYCIIGNGFIAKALKEKIGDYSWYPEKDTKVLFYLGGVTHMDFEKNPEYHSKQNLGEFMFLLEYAKQHNIHFIYPSSALVYEKDTQFSTLKKMMEEFAKEYRNSLAVRMFPVYGYGENKTVISKWCNQMKNGEQPVIYGSGDQTRDFINIEDVTDYLIKFAEESRTGIVDLGPGNPISFNKIIEIINEVLDKKIEPLYAPAPPGYNMKGVKNKNKLAIKVNIKDGIRKKLLG